MRNHPIQAGRITAGFRPLALLALTAVPAARGAAPSPDAPASMAPAAVTAPAVMPAPIDAQQVITLLDQTIQWYRARGADRDLATQPSDWLILSENDRTARQILSMAFAIARADARLLAMSGNRSAGPRGPRRPARPPPVCSD